MSEMTQEFPGNDHNMSCLIPWMLKRTWRDRFQSFNNSFWVPLDYLCTLDSKQFVLSPEQGKAFSFGESILLRTIWLKCLLTGQIPGGEFTLFQFPAKKLWQHIHKKKRYISKHDSTWDQAARVQPELDTTYQSEQNISQQLGIGWVFLSSHRSNKWIFLWRNVWAQSTITPLRCLLTQCNCDVWTKIPSFIQSQHNTEIWNCFTHLLQFRLVPF